MAPLALPHCPIGTLNVQTPNVQTRTSKPQTSRPQKSKTLNNLLGKHFFGDRGWSSKPGIWVHSWMNLSFSYSECPHNIMAAKFENSPEAQILKLAARKTISWNSTLIPSSMQHCINRPLFANHGLFSSQEP